MASITLSEIRAAADKKFAPTSVDLEDGKAPIELVHPLRLDGKKRARLTGLSDELGAEGADPYEVVAKVLTDASPTPAEGKRLVAAANGDVTVLMAFLDAWVETTDMGEAATSES